jgi:hypothetical protein
MLKKINQQEVNLDSRIFLETQEDFVFNRDIDISKDQEFFHEEGDLILEDWLEVERILR